MEEYQDYEMGGEKIGNQKQYLMLKRLIEAVFNDIELAKISQILEDILGKPALVMDMGFYIAAQSPSIAHSPAFADVCTQTGFLCDFYQELIRSHYLYPQLQERTFVSTVIPCVECGGLLIASIKISQADAMLLLVFLGGQKPSKEDFLLVKKICQVLSVEFQKPNKSIHSRLSLPNYSLDVLLSGKWIDRADFFRKTDYLKWVRAKELYLLLLGGEGKTTLDKRISSLIHQLKFFIPVDHCLLYDDVLVCFLTRKLYLRVFEQDRQAFHAFAEQNQLQATVSGAFSDIMDSHRMFVLTRKIQAIAHRFQVRVLQAETAQMYIIAGLLQENCYDILDFCHPAIQILRNFDAKNSTQLVQTLRCYLDGKPDIESVVERLYIHRSTLFYRLKKIKELTGLTLENVAELSWLYFSFQILQLCCKDMLEGTEG